MLTKSEQLKHNKKPKAKKVSKNKPTEHEREYLQWLQSHEANCSLCAERNGIEWHHVKRSSVEKKDHTKLIPLCGVKCHRLGKFSAHGNPKWFRETFPIEEQKRIADEYYYEFVSLK